MGVALSAKQQTLLIAEQNLYNHFPRSAEISSRKVLMQWCANLGYKDSNVNMLDPLSYTLYIKERIEPVFFDQYACTLTFRIWLSEIRFNAAKKMMLEYPDYSNDIISAECGFSARTHLYRIFKTKEGCTPTEWREVQFTDAAQNDQIQDNHFSINTKEKRKI